MFKLPVVLIISLGAITGFANTDANEQKPNPNPMGWVEVYSSKEQAKGPAGFAILQKKYSVFTNIDPLTVTSADYGVVLYEYRDKNTCDANDSRLWHKSLDYGFCDSFNLCRRTLTSNPKRGDPCAPNKN
jgi:hypothetical protein